MPIVMGRVVGRKRRTVREAVASLRSPSNNRRLRPCARPPSSRRSNSKGDVLLPRFRSEMLSPGRSARYLVPMKKMKVEVEVENGCEYGSGQCVSNPAGCATFAFAESREESP